MLAPKLRLDAEHNLAGAEWFGDIIVSARGETENFIHIIIFRRKEQDGAIGELPNLPAYLQTVHIRKHDIENDRVRLEFAADVHRIRAATGLSDIPETVLAQDFFHKVCNIFFQCSMINDLASFSCRLKNSHH